MRVRVAIGLGVLSMTLGAGLVACFDLFHSTSDVLTACERDADIAGCQPDARVEAGGEAGTDFCAWSETTALENARHACAWLGACESPLGRNAFGSCMFAALGAYDCVANPNHPVQGTTHALWDCLWKATSCDAINACVFPQGSQVCYGGDFVTCASPKDGRVVNADVRVECFQDGGAPNGENCALWGQTCGGNISIGVCGGTRGEQAIACDAGSSCVGESLHFCSEGGIDLGIDCADNGAQKCAGFPSGDAGQWVACVPESDGGTCPFDGSAQCAGGVATSCPAGLVETVNCQTLLGGAEHACVPGPLSPPFDWTSPCVVSGGPGEDSGAEDAGDAGGCVDSCDGGQLTSCYRGALFPLDCSSVGLGPCAMVVSDEMTSTNAACGKHTSP